LEKSPSNKNHSSTKNKNIGNLLFSKLYSAFETSTKTTTDKTTTEKEKRKTKRIKTTTTTTTTTNTAATTTTKKTKEWKPHSRAATTIVVCDTEGRLGNQVKQTKKTDKAFFCPDVVLSKLLIDLWK
jgi:hypothetical protein